MLEYQIFFDYGPMILLGFWLTLKIVVCAIALGIPLGLFLALGRRSNFRIISFISTSFIELFRNTPFIIQVFLFYYVLPFYGLRLSAEYVGILALAAFGSAYFAEIIRAGIDAVPKGQLESARAIGMTDWQAMKNIILPQTISIVLPPLTNQTLTLIKESAVLSTITVHELTMTGLMVQGETFRPFEVFIMVALLYWALNETIATIMRKLEKKFSKDRKKTTQSLDIKGREFLIKEFYEGIVRFTFNELCDKNLGAEDYLEIVKVSKFIVIDQIPKFDDINSNQQHRFITLIDIVYDKKVPLAVTIEKSLDELTSSKSLKEPFKRTISRLYELTSSNFNL